MAQSNADRIRKWREKQKQGGKKPVSVMLSQAALDILAQEQKKTGKKQGAVVERAIMGLPNRVTSNAGKDQALECIHDIKVGGKKSAFAHSFVCVCGAPVAIYDSVGRTVNCDGCGREWTLEMCAVCEPKGSSQRRETREKPAAIIERATAEPANPVTCNAGNVTSNGKKRKPSPGGKPDPHRELVLKRIATMKNKEGLSFKGIATAFNDEGLATMSGKGKWHGRSVSKLYHQQKAAD